MFEVSMVMLVVGGIIGYAVGKEPGDTFLKKFWSIIETPCDEVDKDPK